MPFITADPFGTVPGRGEASLFTLTNGAGNSVRISDFGGIITSIRYDNAEMVVGFDTIDGYLRDNPYYGALIGRYGNRIAGATFELDGRQYRLPANNGPHQLHGGPLGFDKYLWRATTAVTATDCTLTLHHISEDGDMGYPGRLEVSCHYTWDDNNALRIRYLAKTDRPTVVNLTNHSYFNIGNGDTIHDQHLQLAASRYTPVSAEMIPTGEFRSVGSTDFDFRTERLIGGRLESSDPQISQAGGFDHNFVVDDYDGQLRDIAVVTDRASGRRLRCATTEPGVQVFTANFHPGEFFDRGDTPLPRHAAICLETQHFPDSPNQPAFRTPRLDPGEVYDTTTVYRFESIEGNKQGLPFFNSRPGRSD